MSIESPELRTKRKNTSKGLIWGSIALVGLFIGGVAAAAGGKPNQPKPKPKPKPKGKDKIIDVEAEEVEPTPEPPEPEPEPDEPKLKPPAEAEPEPEPDEPEDDPSALKFDLETNWGGIPPALRVWLARFELAAQIPGLARFLGVKAWQAFRAMQPYVTTAQATAIAAANPELARNFFNAGDGLSAKKGIDQGIDQGWPVPVDRAGWSSGSFGLFDILGSSAVWAGVHTDAKSWLPYVKVPSAKAAMRTYEVQGGAASYIVRRILFSDKYKVLDPGVQAANGNSLQTWGNIASAYAAPDAYASGTQSAVDRKTRFLARAVEIGIDLAAVAYPWPPGVTYKAPAWTFKQVYDRLASYAKRPVVNG